MYTCHIWIYMWMRFESSGGQKLEYSELYRLIVWCFLIFQVWQYHSILLYEEKKHHKHNLKHLFLCSSEERFSSVLITIPSSANDKTEAKEINQRAHLHTCFAWDRARWEGRALDVYCNQAFISLPEESTDVSHSKWHIALRTQMLLLHKIHDSCFLSLSLSESISGVHWELRPAVPPLQLYWGRLRSPWENCIRRTSTSRHQRNTITSVTSAVFETYQRNTSLRHKWKQWFDFMENINLD